MLKRFKSLLKDTSGNVAMTTAIVIIPVIASVGAAIDYSRWSDMRSDVLNSADAANLAVGNIIANGRVKSNGELMSNDELEEVAAKFFRANLDAKVTDEMYEFDMEIVEGDSSVEPATPDRARVTVELDYDTIFGDWVGVDIMEETLISEITMGNRTVEVALVLDNSGSMGSNNRINTLKTEAKNLVDTIFNSASLTTLPDPVQFSLVPFAGTVNVGTGNANKNWIDKKGWSPVHHENFDWSTYRTNNQTRTRTRDGLTFGFQEKISGSWKWKTRFDVFDMVGEDWGGCVEMRPWPHNVMDTYTPVNKGYRVVRDSLDADNDGIGDGTSALFVPYFAPDEPDSRFAEDPGNDDYWFTTGVDHDGDDDGYRNNYLYDFWDYNPNNPSQSIQLYTDVSATDPAYQKKGSTNQIDRTNWMFKYQTNQQFGNLGEWYGPNDGCTVNPLNELSDQRQDIKDNIDDMQANGTTNIQQGLMWGWRTLSPTEPFTGGRDYDHKRNMKFIVLLTDGNNFYSTDGDSTPNNTAYGAWGYARPDNNHLVNPLNGLATHNRWIEGLDEQLAGTIYATTSFEDEPDSGSEFEAIMNAHTLQACNNIKNSGISIYAVAFDVPSSGGVRDLMEACSGSGVRDGSEIIPNTAFYHDVNGSQLADAFANIAKQIASLRIAQ